MKRNVLAFIMLGISIFSLEAQEDATPISPVLPAVLNFIPGFGLGSFLQQDSEGATILLVIDCIGYGITGGCILYALGSMILSSITWNFIDLWDDSVAFRVILITGLCIILGNRIYGIIRPVWYYSAAAGETQKDKLAFRIEPAMRRNPEKTGYYIGVTLKLVHPLL
jgi:hypothetical protein